MLLAFWLSVVPVARIFSADAAPTLEAVKAQVKTKLTREERIGEPAPFPPTKLFDLIHYSAPPGKLAAYVSPDPGDGKKHPLIIWRVGGFANSISDLHWTPQESDNDQSASQYRLAGVLTMYPSLRGGNDNPGFIECCHGEVEDVLAAAEHAKKLPYVDPAQIYLGGHSVGGTLALLVASMDKSPFKAVFSFGPAHSVVIYGQERLPFDAEDKMELVPRAPVVFLNHIKTDVWVMEGSEGNIDALKLMKERTKNAKIRFWEAAGDHFSILAPINEVIARQIIQADKSPDKTFTLDKSMIDGALGKADR